MMIGRALVAVSMLLAVTAPAAPAEAAEPAKCLPERGTLTIGESWAQRRFNLPDVWQLTRGAGVTVAVIDSGLNTGHPQLTRAGAYEVTGTGTRDCFGHGTAVAGIIGAAPTKGSPFVGVAPAAKLISIKHTDDRQGDVGRLAQAIVKAVELGADVINVSVEASNVPDLNNAVAYALSKDVVVVAAAGNTTKEDGTPVPSYPAAYPGVLSVGGAGPDGARVDSSNATTPVTVVGPGKEITSTWPFRAYKEGLVGTSFAAPYVAGTVALVRSRYPELTNAEVVRRIALTADGGSGTGTGAGMVNPLLAVSAILPSETVALAPQEPAPLAADAIRPAPPVDSQSISIAVWVALLSLMTAVVVTLGSVAIPLGRRRRWRPGTLENGT
ncbi:type VII secretion-associated serine protease mycosin [Streptosporangium album]|uniref:Type VII secretion-associated serine protease mycosin n=1 Tax=Streptosporangium album TaxID=47479 RepID=A0A7W7RS16_9ACTN|nr:type VII secretion-associated serine protease mycosin [Streptosporangium album]MBB4937128.1 type VII secretion-associated serine protease mycosin [Streptosporangium album]